MTSLQFEKERHALLCISKLFINVIHQLSLQNAWLPQVSFWISIALEIHFLQNHKPGQKFELVGTVLNHVPSVSVLPSPWERGWGVKPKMKFKKFDSKESG